MRPDIFTPTLLEFDRMWLLGMDEAITGALDSVRGQLFLCLSLYVLMYACLIMFHKVDVFDFAMAGFRALAVSLLLQSTNFNFYVRDLFFTDLPNMWAASMGGPREGINTAQQFDQLWSAALNATSIVLRAASHWTEFMDRGLAWVYAFFMLIAIMVQAVVWLASRACMALLICVGAFLIVLYLFPATREFPRQWIGKVVSILAFQLTASILLRIILAVTNSRIVAMQAQMGSSVDTMLASLSGIAGVFWMGALLMLCVPTLVAFSSGAAASAAVAHTTTRAAAAPLRTLVR